MDIIESPSPILDSKLVNQTDLQSLKSGAAGNQETIGVVNALGLSNTLPDDTWAQCHLAKPVAPPGQGWTTVSPAFVQFQYNPRVTVGMQ